MKIKKEVYGISGAISELYMWQARESEVEKIEIISSDPHGGNKYLVVIELKRV